MNDGLDLTYRKYAEAFTEMTDMEFKIQNLNLLTKELRRAIRNQDKTGEYALTISGHASQQINRRLSELAHESKIIFDDVHKPDNPSLTLLAMPNMESFILGLLSLSRQNNGVTIENSKNSNGKEYHYNVEIKDWGIDGKKLIFTGLVENNNLKTGFFNWI